MPNIPAKRPNITENINALLSQRDVDGQTPLSSAIDSCSARTFEKLIAQNPSLVHKTDKEGHTPLHKAVACGRADIVTTLCRWGADAQAKDHAGLLLIAYALTNRSAISEALNTPALSDAEKAAFNNRQPEDKNPLPTTELSTIRNTVRSALAGSDQHARQEEGASTSARYEMARSR